MSRKSIAVYYFREEGAVRQLCPTNYRPMPSDPLHKRTLMAVDRSLLWVYSFLKRRRILNDKVVEKLFRHL